ncbi:MAG: hypothetical protein CVU41_09500 [Chloroflexi bacterium HGW-Chloroflexi-3]|nr:MAG: hypothetical protein CVU41_09500 [Chloroflexi bacterium HGW-Chloroflexi-3]
MSKPNVFLKSTLRQPIFTIFLLFILGLISFAFVSKVTEYLVVQRETERLGGYYRSIGTLRNISDPLYGYITEGAEIVRTSPYLDYEDYRRDVSAVMNDIYNSDIEARASETNGPLRELVKNITNNNFWFYGTLDSKKEMIKTIDYNQPSAGYSLTFSVGKVAAGYPEHIEEGQEITLLFLLDFFPESSPWIEEMKVGQHYFIRGFLDAYFTPNPTWTNADSNLILKLLDGEDTWFLPVLEQSEVDLNEPGLEEIKNEIEIDQQQQHSLLVLATVDMSAMPNTQEVSQYLHLVSGRWLNHEDELNASKVMVVRNSFAQLRDIQVGDTISLIFRDLQDYFHGGYIYGEDDRQNWRSYPTYPDTFEVVGIFESRVGIDPNLVFIPQSTLPVEIGIIEDEVHPMNYSFVLKSSKDQDVFINETQDRLAEVGIEVSFVENKGKNFWAGVDPLRKAAAANLPVYGLVLLLTLLLVIFLYLTQRRRDYAILCALGVPRKSANRQMLIPILLIGLLSISAGSVSAWNFALNKAAESLSTLLLPSGIAPSASLHAGILIGMGTGIFILLQILTGIGIWLISRRNIFELLQGKNAPKVKTQAAPPNAQDEIIFPPQSAIKMQTPVATKKKPSTGLAQIKQAENKVSRPKKKGALLRLMLCWIRRSGLKSALTIAVAAGFILAIGWLRWMIDRNQAEVDRLYNTTFVQAEILYKNPDVSYSFSYGVFGKDVVKGVLRTGFVESAYLEAIARRTRIGGINGENESYQADIALRGINHADTFFNIKLQGAAVEYADGWDGNLFTKTWTTEEIQASKIPAVFPKDFSDQYNLKPGDTVVLTDGSHVSYSYLVAGKYTRGYVGSSEEPVLLPLSALEAMEGENILYQAARFTLDPSKNRQLETFRTRVDYMLASYQRAVPLKMVYWDEELRSVVQPLEKSLSLLQVLYPVTVAVAVLIGLGLNLLLVLQSARDAAILRVLGIPTGQVRGMYSIQQLLLSLFGIFMGLAGVAIIHNEPAALLENQLIFGVVLFLGGALLGALLGVYLTTNKNPLGLLQVKE